MVDKKITELASVTGDNLADDDVFVVVDISEDETKKVTREEFFKSIPNITVEGTTSGYAIFKTASSFGGAGVEGSSGDDTLTFIDFNAPDISVSGGSANYRFGRGTTEGDTSSLTFYAHDGTNNPVINLNSSGEAYFAGSVTPKVDNTVDLGSPSNRWDDVYATNGTIQTSDLNEKQDIESLNDAEVRVAKACKGLLRKFRWKDSVAEKGDNSRIHFGIIAQDLQNAFTAEGLDAGDYAMFISTTWWEAEETVPEVDGEPEHTETKVYYKLSEAPEGAKEFTRLGVRYPELLAFIIAVV
jgi:hypothetical protein